VLSTMPGLVTAIFYGRISVTKESYAATQNALAQRRDAREATAAGDSPRAEVGSGPAAAPAGAARSEA